MMNKKPFSFETNSPGISEYVSYGGLVDQYKVIEYPQSLLEELETNPSYEFVVKGTHNAVLCTSDRSFHLMKVHCTNSLLVKEPIFNRVECEIDHYFECIPKPSGIITLELYNILYNNSSPHTGESRASKSRYGMEEEEEEDEDEDEGGENNFFKGRSRVQKDRKHKNYTLDDLENDILGSIGEIQSSLKEIGAVGVPTRIGPKHKLKEVWKLLDPKAEQEIIRLILLTIRQMEYPLDRVKGDIIERELRKNYDRISILNCLRKLSKKKKKEKINPGSRRTSKSGRKLIMEDEDEEEEEEDEELDQVIDNIWKFNICQIEAYFAELIFEEHGEKTMRIETFKKELRNHIKPFQNQQTLTHTLFEKDLYGVVVFNEKNNHCRCVNKYLLPVDIEERMKILFRWKPRWRLEEIKPFIVPYEREFSTSEQILTKQCRMTRGFGNSERFYVKK